MPKRCPAFSPCKLIRARWARAAKAVIDTAMTKQEHGYALCRGLDGRPKVYKYCEGTRCRIYIEPCKTPLERLGSFHTHPAVEPEMLWERGYFIEQGRLGTGALCPRIMPEATSRCPRKR